MESLVCAGVMGIVAFAAYTQSRKHKKANEDNKARIWMIASVIAGAIAVVSIAAAIAG
jgi:hypothetical protein